MLGLKPGKPWAVLAGASELGGGLLTVLGFLNPLGPLGVIGSMAMATTTAHRGKPIWVTEGGAELPVTNIAAAMALIIGGPGRLSVDNALGLRLPRWITPLALAAILVTVSLRPQPRATAPGGAGRSPRRHRRRVACQRAGARRDSLDPSLPVLVARLRPETVKERGEVVGPGEHRPVPGGQLREAPLGAGELAEPGMT